MMSHSFQCMQHLPHQARKTSKCHPQSDVCELYTVKFILHNTSDSVQLNVMHKHTHTHTHDHFTALLDFVWDYLGEKAPER